MNETNKWFKVTKFVSKGLSSFWSKIVDRLDRNCDNVFFNALSFIIILALVFPISVLRSMCLITYQIILNEIEEWKKPVKKVVVPPLDLEKQLTMSAQFFVLMPIYIFFGLSLKELRQDLR